MLERCLCCDAPLRRDEVATVGSVGAVAITLCEACFEQCHTWTPGTAWEDTDGYAEPDCTVTGRRWAYGA